jgi:hypothetical protein
MRSPVALDLLCKMVRNVDTRTHCTGLYLTECGKKMHQRSHIVVQPSGVHVDQRRRELVAHAELHHLVAFHALHIEMQDALFEAAVPTLALVVLHERLANPPLVTNHRQQHTAG